MGTDVVPKPGPSDAFHEALLMAGFALGILAISLGMASVVLVRPIWVGVLILVSSLFLGLAWVGAAMHWVFER